MRLFKYDKKNFLQGKKVFVKVKQKVEGYRPSLRFYRWVNRYSSGLIIV
jgi:hypothetical protein